MIYLYTGTPGAGKTLFTLRDLYDAWEKESRAKAKGESADPNEWRKYARPVYVHRVKDLAVPGWNVLDDGTKWPELPDHSIILIDECHETFPVRPNGSQVPEHVLRLADHRHRGIDLWLVTQHPMEVDTALRRRVNEHSHIVRRFGSKRVAFYSWGSTCDNPDKSRKSGFKRERSYPTEVYTWYKSAEAHTVKFRLPREAWYFMAAALLIPLLGYALLQVMYRLGLKKEEKLENVVTLAKDNGAPPGQTSPLPARRSAAESNADYLAAMVPRVAGLPHTAPAYDRLTQAVRVPIPAACIESKSACRCWSQSATPLPVDDSVCRQIVRGGFYVAFETDTRRDDRARPLPVNAPEPGRPVPGPGRGLPEFDGYVGVKAGPPVLAFDRSYGGSPAGSVAVDAAAGPVVDQAQGIGRGRVVH